MTMEQRVSRLEGTYEQVDRRLDDMNRAIQGLREEVNGLRTETRADADSLRAEVNSRFNNLYLLLGGMWATIIAGFVAIFLRL